MSFRQATELIRVQSSSMTHEQALMHSDGSTRYAIHVTGCSDEASQPFEEVKDTWSCDNNIASVVWRLQRRR